MYNGLEVAIIGMSGQFPESEDCSAFWDNLKCGNEMIKTFSDEELISSGVLEQELKDNNFVRAQAVLENKDCFDHGFFEYNPDEAAFMDPQIRLFHEHCWKALEDAGYSSKIESQKIGLFAGASNNQNWQIYAAGKTSESSIDPFFMDKITDRRFISTLVSYKLNLTGPSFYIDTACSTSLAAVHLACRSLLTKDCSIALAGAAMINTYKRKGYYYQEGGVASKDGHCRAFDVSSSGTASGEGLGVVVLKKLSDAIKDKDNIYAIIKSTVANNDGNRKVGYTAPSINGQVECIKMAHKLAGIDPSEISYIEAHGTGTHLGDPIEIKSLNEAFNLKDSEKFCAIGSVKTNIGHLDSSAGIAGLIKVALSLRNKQIPASLHFKTPNPGIDFSGGPFFVNTELKNWNQVDGKPLRAAVSSFGIGGTNVHAVLEQGPILPKGNKGRNYKLLVLSAKTKSSLLRYMGKFKDYLLNNPNINLSDMAYTLQVGRKHFAYRETILFENFNDLIKVFESNKFEKSIIRCKENNANVVFMFSGAGSQYLNMGKDLYEGEAIFKIEMDRGFEELKRMTNYDYKSILYSSEDNDSRVNQMLHTQPIIFLFGYSLARLLISYGVVPKYMIGHSIGEYIAACLSGVFNFEDALKLVVRRGELMDKLQGGAMVSVAINEIEAGKYLSNTISLAAINGPEQVVFSGDIASIDLLIQEFQELNILCVKLYASQAGHSHMIDDILENYKEVLETISMEMPKIPFLSNLTGNLIKNDEATSVDYWLKHMRNTVKFDDCLKTLLNEKNEKVFIELGGGHSLTSLLKQQVGQGKPFVINLIRHPKEDKNDLKYFTDNIGQLWLRGVQLDWTLYNSEEIRYKISLPVYSFDQYKYPTEVDGFGVLNNTLSLGTDNQKRSVNDWFYRILWKQSLWLPEKSIDFAGKYVLLFLDNDPVSTYLKNYFARQHINAVFVYVGTSYEKKNDVYFINPDYDGDFEKLFSDLNVTGKTPSNIYHLWNFETEEELNKHFEFYNKLGYESLLKIVKNFATFFSSSTLRVDIISNKLYSILGNEPICADKSTILGAVKVIPIEFSNIFCRAIDIGDTSAKTLNSLVTELNYDSKDKEVAIRESNRYEKDYEKITFAYNNSSVVFRTNGTYVITGANGGMGKTFAHYLASTFRANLILIGRGNIQPETINSLESLGASVTYIKTDISDFEKVSDGILKSENKYGSINGVIHTAGLADFAGIILRRNKDDDDKVFAPKIIGTQVLNSIFKNKKLDFFVNCSSQNASLATFGQVAYVTSNIYQDTFALAGNVNFPVISIEWTTLKEIGMAVNAFSNLSLSEQMNKLQHGIMPSEAIEILIRAIYLKIPIQVISREDFKNELTINDNPDLIGKYLNVDYDFSSVNKLERPDLSSEFVAPITNTEIELKKIFEDFFGFENIGIDDSFFELGGDSLKALGLLLRIKKNLNVNIILSNFFKNATIRQLALEIDELNSFKNEVKSEVVKKKLVI